MAQIAPVADGEIRLEAVVTKAEFIGPLIRLDAETREGTLLKAAILDTPQAHMTPGSPIILAFETERVSVFRQSL